MATAGGMGIWYILYLKHFERGGDLNENDLISELDLDYIHHLIVLCDLKIMAWQGGRLLGSFK